MMNSRFDSGIVGLVRCLAATAAMLPGLSSMAVADGMVTPTGGGSPGRVAFEGFCTSGAQTDLAGCTSTHYLPTYQQQCDALLTDLFSIQNALNPTHPRSWAGPLTFTDNDPTVRCDRQAT